MDDAIKEQNRKTINASITSANSLAKVIYDKNTLEDADWGGNGLGGYTFTGELSSSLSKTKDIIDASKFNYITYNEDDGKVEFKAETNQETVFMIAEMQRLKEELENTYDSVFLQGDKTYSEIVKTLG
jgi:hypothetical protein